MLAPCLLVSWAIAVRGLSRLAVPGEPDWSTPLPWLVYTSAADRSVQVEQRDELVRLRLPPGQRAAIVLRYWEDLSDAEAADVLGCSASTVRSSVARGLHRLRELSGARAAVAADQVAADQRGRAQ
jgi:DNA-directed RNA polymerase specialized sigma24 family protein